MELGGSDERGPSWLARMLNLRDRDDLGPFRLALMEALLKAADERASGAES
jgi:CRISPR-associated endonuclease/helicase Cas3